MYGGSLFTVWRQVSTLLKTNERNQSTDAVFGNILNSPLILQKLVGFLSSWVLTFYGLYLAAFICSVLKMQYYKQMQKFSTVQRHM